MRTKAITLLLIPLPVSLAAIAGLYRAQRSEREARMQFEDAQQVQRGIQDTSVRLLDAEAAALSALLAGDAPALQRCVESRALLASSAERLQTLVAASPSQSRRAKEVRELIESEAKSTASCGDNHGQKVAREAGGLASRRGSGDAAGRAGLKLAAMEMEEERLLQARSYYVQNTRWRPFTVVIESTIVGLFFQTVAALLLTGTLSGQIRALEDDVRLFCQGLARRPVIAETREVHGLAREIQQAAALLANNESALRESEERFRTLFQEAPIAYHETDREGVIRHVNSAECVLLGIPAEKILGKHIWDLMAGESRDVIRRNTLDRLASFRPTSPYECDLECADQSLVTVEVHENLIQDKQGKVAGIRTALLDITARKMMETAAKTVQQYAKELWTKNEELLLALEAARDASASKGRFLAAMSHELRTPLNAIIGLAELMFDGVVGAISEQHKEYLGDILDSSRYLLRLINDVLDLAKVESGKMKFYRELVDVGALLCEARDVLWVLAEKKKISITVDTGEPITVVTDGSKLKQVVYNYLSNAIKFTGEGGAIQVRARLGGADTFRIEVEDSGPGIDEADIPRLFADFHQLDGGRPSLGTGLGLAVTKRVVEGQGGSVGVRSKPGVGSVFFAVLPTNARTDCVSGVWQEYATFEGSHREVVKL